MIIHGDCLDELEDIEESSVDMVCTDPPYQLSAITRSRKDQSEEGSYGKEVPFSRVQARKGFMGKAWDVLPSIEIWRECLRVLKPGAFAFILCTPRQDSLYRMIQRLEEAGFIIGFSSIYWTYASGFPKAQNMAKAAGKKCISYFDPIGAQANYDLFTGAYSGFQPKPALEVVLIVMKPLDQKTFVAQALKNGKGITWLGDGRIPYQSEQEKEYTDKPGQGRFPANILCSDDVLNTGEASVSQKSPRGGTNPNPMDWGNARTDGNIPKGHDDSGSFSRFFDLDAWFEHRFGERIQGLPVAAQRTFPFLVCPKPSKAEKNRGLEGMPEGEPPASARSKAAPGRQNPLGKPRANIHPTCKSIQLMSWLITIGSREGDIILDPFCGSGTTLCAARMLDREWIGIEKEKEYIEIATKRVEACGNEHPLLRP